MFDIVLKVLLHLRMQLDISWVRTMLVAGQVLAGFIHVVEAVLEIVFKICGYGLCDL